MAIKVSGTTVINDSRALQNIASVDATTAAAITAGGVGGSGIDGTLGTAQLVPVAGNFLKKGINWTGSEWITVGASGGFSASPDGLAWTNYNIGSSGGANRVLENVIKFGSVYVAAGDNGFSTGGAYYKTSLSGNWSEPTTGNAGAGLCVASSGSLVAMGFSGGFISTSTNGTSWTNRSVSSGNSERVNGIAYSPTLGRWVACDGGGGILTSSNGTSWSRSQVGGGGQTLNDVAWTGFDFQVVGASGAGWKSTNGTSWTANNFPDTSTDYYAVTASGSYAIAIGYQGNCATRTASNSTWKTSVAGNITTNVDTIAASDDYIATTFNTKNVALYSALD